MTPSSNFEIIGREALAEPPSKETLSNLLDSELTRLSQQQTNSGWTSWALVGAIGVICWALLGQWEAGWPPGNTWLMVYAVLSFVRFSMHGFLGFSGSESGAPTGQARFNLGNSSHNQRSQAIYGILQATVLALILVFYPASSSLAKAGAFVFCAAAIMFTGHEFFISFTQRPRRVDVHTASISAFMGRLIVFVFVLSITLSLGRDLLNLPLKAADLRVGSLLVVTVYLIQRVIEGQSNRSIIGNLIRIRRELALGIIPAKEAARHIEIQFLGMRVSDVFRDSAQSFLSQAGVIAARCQEYSRRIDNVVASIRKTPTLPGNQQESILRSAQDAHQSHIKEIKGEMDKLEEAYKKIEVRGRYFLSSAGDAGTAMHDILANLQSSYRDASISFQELVQKMNELGLMVAALAPKPR